MFDQMFATTGITLAANKAVKAIVTAAVKLRAITENYTIEIGALSPAGLALAYTEAMNLQFNVKVLDDLGFDSLIKSILRSEVDTIDFVTKTINNLNGLIVSAGYDKVFASALATEARRYDLLETPVNPYEQDGEIAAEQQATAGTEQAQAA